MMNLDARIIISAADQASKVFKAIGGSAEGMVAKLDRAGKSMMMTGAVLTATVTAPVVAAMVSSVKAAAEFETQMVELRKEVSSMPVEAFQELSRSLRDIPLSVPVDLGDVTAVATQAKEFGVAEEALSSFTRVAAEMAVAIKQPLQQVGESLAVVRKAFDLDVSGVARVADHVQFFADRLNSSESDVLAFVRDNATLSRTMGVAGEQSAALGAALMSQGMTASDAGTAYEGLMKGMAKGKGMQAAAKIARMSSKQFAQAWGEDPMKALSGVMANVAKLGTVQEQHAALASIVGNKQAIALMPLIRAWADMAAAQEEAARGAALGAVSAKTVEQMKSYDAQVRMLANTWRDLRIEVGTAILPVITPQLEWLREFIQEWTAGPEGAARVDLAVKLGMGAAVIGPLLIAAGAVIRSLVAIGGAAWFAAKMARTLAGPLFALGVAGTAAAIGVALLVGAIGLAAWNRWPEIAGNVSSFAEAAGNAASATYDLAKAIVTLDTAEARRSSRKMAEETVAAGRNAFAVGSEIASEMFDWLGMDWLSEFYNNNADKFREAIARDADPSRHEREKNRPPVTPLPVYSKWDILGAGTSQPGIEAFMAIMKWWNSPASAVPDFIKSNGPSHRDPLPASAVPDFIKSNGPSHRDPLPASAVPEGMARPPWRVPLVPNHASIYQQYFPKFSPSHRDPLPVLPGQPERREPSDEIRSLLNSIKIKAPDFAPGSLDSALAGKVEAEIKGQADVNVRIQVDGGRVTSSSATASGNIKPRVGVDNTGAPQLAYGGAR